MKLLRAECPCGFYTQKARSGYHRDKWWFPIFSKSTKTLFDQLVSLPSELRSRIDEHDRALNHQTPRDDEPARRKMTAKIKDYGEEVRTTFIKHQTSVLREQYAGDESLIFDPQIGTELFCPRCEKDSLVLNQVRVTAICKKSCGHTYEWVDSEQHGCPKCDYRPHAFRTETEELFEGELRTLCKCRCFSSTDCISHIDGFCPKCGELPSSYLIDNKRFCGMHHEQMLPYSAPDNFLFINIFDIPSERFPNAKLFGEAESESKAWKSSYCVSCEELFEEWKKSSRKRVRHREDRP